MSDVYRFFEGDAPLLISVPHDGRLLPPHIESRMTTVGRSIPDTDWHVAELYEFAQSLGASVIVANYSRYVVDLNRSAEDEHLYPGQVATGLCPLQTFCGADIYADNAVDIDEQLRRIEQYWVPYHNKIRNCLSVMLETHGHALLWDAHSIGSEVPRLFDGELPALNLGSNDTRTCAPAIESTMAEILSRSPYSHVINGRFKGGYITRNYGRPENNVHALQLEIAQRSYMDEVTQKFDNDKAAQLRDTLREMLSGYLKSAIQ